MNRVSHMVFAFSLFVGLYSLLYALSVWLSDLGTLYELLTYYAMGGIVLSIVSVPLLYYKAPNKNMQARTTSNRSAVGAMFFFVFMGGAIGPAILGSAMNASYESALQSRLPAELNRIADEATLESLVDSRVLLSTEAMNALEQAMQPAGEQARDLFDQTVMALRDSLKVSLRTVFLMNAICVLAAFLLILTIPEVPIDVETPDKRPRT